MTLLRDGKRRCDGVPKSSLISSTRRHAEVCLCASSFVPIVSIHGLLGAIMFNDTLTLEQCKTVVSRLSETALPFQCAHGR